MSNNVSGSNFISNSEILTWMQEKTDGIYGHMRDAMDTSNNRAHAEDALNDIKNQLLQMKTNGKDATEVNAAIHDAIAKYGEEFPEISKCLQGFADDLDSRFAEEAAKGTTQRTMVLNIPGNLRGGSHVEVVGRNPDPVTLDEKQIDDWAKAIGDKVDGLGKQDQLGLINIQEFNAQLNQAKQTASALMDAADKAANSIISHIS